MLAGEGGEPVKAIIKIKSGPPEVLQLQEVERPTPGPDEVLIKIHAATVTRGDVVLRSMPDLMLLAMRLFMGMRRKKIPGTELAGEIEAVGSDVSHFSPGDPDLPMSKIIITKHGGQVHVSSPESNAITLTVLLPVNSNSI